MRHGDGSFISRTSVLRTLPRPGGPTYQSPLFQRWETVFREGVSPSHPRLPPGSGNRLPKYTYLRNLTALPPSATLLLWAHSARTNTERIGCRASASDY